MNNIRTLPEQIKQLITSNKPLLSNAVYLTGTAVATSGWGVAYWWLAARLFSQTAVGIASAVISAMMLLGNIATVGVGILMIGELPRRPGRELPLIVTSLLVSSIAGLIVAPVFAVITLIGENDLQVLANSPLHLGLFIIGVALSASTLVLDQALIGLLFGKIQFARNFAFSVIKLVLLGLVGLWLADLTGMLIFFTWVLGSALSLVIPAVYMRRTLRSSKPGPLLQLGLLRELGASAINHHFLALTLDSPMSLMPVMVAMLLSPEANANFYIAWMIASLMFVPVGSLTMVLYAVGAKNPEELRQKLRFSLRLSVVLGTAGYLLLWLSAGLLLQLFGTDYAALGVTPLRIVSLGVFPLIVKDHFVAIHRINNRIGRATLITGIGLALEILFPIIGAQLSGLSGFCAGWVIAVSLEAVYMFVAVYQTMRVPGSKQPVSVPENL